MVLARRIVLLVLAMFLALLGVLGYFEARRAVRAYDAGVAADLALTGRALRPSFAEVWDVEGEARALAVLGRAATDIAHVRIGWTPLRDAEGAGGLSAEQVAALGRDEQVVRERDHVLHVYVPVLPHGAIALSRPLDEERDVVIGVIEERLVVAVGAVVGAVILSVLLGVVFVGRPMRSLVEQARRIGAGDLSTRAIARRDDEIGELASEMNAMCERLASAQARAAAEAEARIEAVEQLRHESRLSTVGRLASGMAHELGTPLSVIAGRAKMIAMRETSADETEQSARTILGQTERMTKIMRGLLDFARRRSAHKSPADLAEIARRTRDLLAPLARKRDVDLRLSPGAEEPAIAAVDVAQVEQALANLVVNGIHASRHGGALVVRTERARRKPPAVHGGAEADFVRVSVEDSGDGIAAEHLPHIFEPFFTTKDVGEGTGLGLSVAYGIMEDHGGWIDVESEIGKGSRFSLYFAAAPVAGEAR
jgi:signal transduction histidine kinase